MCRTSTATTLSPTTYGTGCDKIVEEWGDSNIRLDLFLCTLKIFGVFPERQLGPFGHAVHGLSIVFGLFVEGGILVARQHLVFLGKVEFQMVYFGKTGGFLVGQFQRLVQDLDVLIHKLHSAAEPVFLGRRHARGDFPEVAAAKSGRRTKGTKHDFHLTKCDVNKCVVSGWEMRVRKCGSSVSVRGKLLGQFWPVLASSG